MAQKAYCKEHGISYGSFIYQHNRTMYMKKLDSILLELITQKVNTGSSAAMEYV
ncbi:hypothetical protein [Legionella geestiana]|uniref:hypothetical protein n=1 Tax=Legionella geestiana TaxID=45065 RepID=UPI003CC81198